MSKDITYITNKRVMITNSCVIMSNVLSDTN